MNLRQGSCSCCWTPAWRPGLHSQTNPWWKIFFPTMAFLNNWFMMVISRWQEMNGAAPYWTLFTLSQHGWSWNSRIETFIQEKIMHQCPLIPNKYWFYLLRYCCDIRNRTALNIYSLEGRTPYEKMTGAVPDNYPYVLFRHGEPIFLTFEKASGTSREFPP